jgi:hypothetical protein
MKDRIRDLNGEFKQVHGMTKSRFHNIWLGMKNRCLNPNVKAYPRYGGKGIKVCDEWLNFINFKNDMYDLYLEHCNKYGEKDTTLDRIDSEGDYCKANCKWSTYKEQALNRTTNIKLFIGGKYISANEVVKRYGLTHSALYHRLNRGWSTERIISTPMKQRCNK